MSDVRVQSNAADDLADDLILGVAPIAKAIGRTYRQTWHLIDTGKLPVKRVGKKFCASRAGLRLFFAPVVAGKVD
jgi:hypothetical protein